MYHPAFATVVSRIETVCRIAAPRTMLTDLRSRFERSGLTRAVAQHDTPALFDWLMQVLSYQGVSDAVAWGYMNRYGTIAYTDIDAALAAAPSCPKLRSHWHFEGCHFAKGAFSCAEPAHRPACPLPHHDLRNGRLNQTAYSLILFLRDVCDGDLVGWIDARLAGADLSDDQRINRMRDALLEPLTAVYGASFKVMAMALADLLLAGDADRERWTTTGASMIVIDTLVHNWLVRTGSLHELGATHPYGAGCYRPGGCASIIEAASQAIDARRYCPEGPAVFPRLVQKAVWLFCTEAGLGVCNGNRIDDRHGCRQASCALYDDCARLLLR